MTSGNCLLGAISIMITFKCFNLFYLKTKNFPFIHFYVKDRENRFWSYDKNFFDDIIPIIWYKGYFNKKIQSIGRQPKKIFNIY